jgi:hypothetical protein
VNVWESESICSQVRTRYKIWGTRKVTHTDACNAYVVWYIVRLNTKSLEDLFSSILEFHKLEITLFKLVLSRYWLFCRSFTCLISSSIYFIRFQADKFWFSKCLYKVDMVLVVSSSVYINRFLELLRPACLFYICSVFVNTSVHQTNLYKNHAKCSS